MPSCPCGVGLDGSVKESISLKNVIYTKFFSIPLTRSFDNAVKQVCQSITPCKEYGCSKYKQKSVESKSCSNVCKSGVVSFFDLSSACGDVCKTVTTWVDSTVCETRNDVCAVEGTIEKNCENLSTTISELSITVNGSFTLGTSTSIGGGVSGTGVGVSESETYYLSVNIGGFVIISGNEKIILEPEGGFITIIIDCKIGISEKPGPDEWPKIKVAGECGACIAIPKLTITSKNDVFTATIGNVVLGVCADGKDGITCNLEGSTDVSVDLGDGVSGSISGSLGFGLPI
jgi:hypothetical protein